MPRDHKSFPRVYVEADLAAGTPVTLDTDQSNHLVNVLRLKQGDAAILFNGRDGAWLAKLTHAGRKFASLAVGTQVAVQTPPSDLWFGFAPLKTGRLDYVVQKAVDSLTSSIPTVPAPAPNSTKVPAAITSGTNQRPRPRTTPNGSTTQVS